MQVYLLWAGVYDDCYLVDVFVSQEAAENDLSDHKAEDLAEHLTALQEAPEEDLRIYQQWKPEVYRIETRELKS